MELQFRKLIVEPFKQVPDNPTPLVLVIDGLDECDDHRTQQKILQLITGALRAHELPMRILIISRPEPHLRETIDWEGAMDICHRQELANDSTAAALAATSTVVALPTSTSSAFIAGKTSFEQPPNAVEDVANFPTLDLGQHIRDSTSGHPKNASAASYPSHYTHP